MHPELSKMYQKYIHKTHRLKIKKKKSCDYLHSVQHSVGDFSPHKLGADCYCTVCDCYFL